MTATSFLIVTTFFTMNFMMHTFRICPMWRINCMCQALLTLSLWSQKLFSNCELFNDLELHDACTSWIIYELMLKTTLGGLATWPLMWPYEMISCDLVTYMSHETPQAPPPPPLPYHTLMQRVCIWKNSWKSIIKLLLLTASYWVGKSVFYMGHGTWLTCVILGKVQ